MGSKIPQSPPKDSTGKNAPATPPPPPPKK